MAVSNVSARTHGNILKIMSLNGIVNNFNEGSPLWDSVKRIAATEGRDMGREARFAVRASAGIGAVGALPVDAGDFKADRQSSATEGTAQYKDYGATISADLTVMSKINSLRDAYSIGDLVDEIELKTDALVRDLTMQALADGTGVRGQALDAGSIASGRITFSFDTASTARGSVTWVEQDDILHAVQTDGTDRAPTLSSGTYDHYRVISVDDDAGTCVIAAESSADAELTVTATNLVAGDYLVRGTTSDTFQDLSSIGSTDYNTLSIEMTGLDSLTEDDSRVVNGITLSGTLGGTRKDVGSSTPLAFKHVQQMMSKLDKRAGTGKYQWETLLMNHDAYDAFVDANETQRQLISSKDNKRGFPTLTYQYAKSSLAFMPDRFMRKQRVYALPNKGALQFKGKEPDFVAPNGGDIFQLDASSSGGYAKKIKAHLFGTGALYCVQPNAIGVIENYAL